MRICAFGRSLPAHNLGGMEIHFKAVTEGLASRGHDVTVLTTRRAGCPDSLCEGGVTIHFLRGTISGRYEFGYWKKSARRFDSLHREKRFDVVLSESAGALGYIMEKARGRYDIPVVFIAHGTSMRELRTKLKEGFFSPRSWAGAARCLANHFRDRRLLGSVETIVGVSAGISADIARELGLESSRVVTVANGIDTSIFRSDSRLGNACRSRSGIGDDTRLLVTGGRLHRQKGLHHVIGAVGEFRRRGRAVKYLAVGDGPYGKGLKELSLRYGLDTDVIFTGRVPHAETAEYYNAADIVLLPSICAEGMPLSLMEAMACKAPVIASRTGGVCELVEDGVNGILIPPGVSDGFSMDRMISRMEEILVETAGVR